MALFRLDRALIRVSGHDRVGFLDNLLTQSVEELVGVRYGALLNPQGKVIADMFIWTHGDAIILETDRSFSKSLMTRLGLYKLRAAVTIEGADDLGALFSEQAFDGAHADPRMPDGAIGYRKLVPVEAALGFPQADSAYHRLIALEGVPELAENIKPEEVFAGEALLDELRGVDFQKGCFVGQENVSRMKRRATTRRKLCRIAFEGEQIDSGTPIRAGDAEIGSVRATGYRRGFAFMRLDRALEAQQRGEKLMAGEHEIRLDPPDWLILPQGAAQAPAGDD